MMEKIWGFVLWVVLITVTALLIMAAYRLSVLVVYGHRSGNRVHAVEARLIIEQLASAGIELDDERLSYMTIQVDRDLVERAKKWLEGGE